MTEENQRDLLNQQIKAVWNTVQWTNTKKDLIRLIMDKEDNRQLIAEIGNLEVQVAEYRQIVRELSAKIKMYEETYGSVFKKSNAPKNN